MRWTIPWVTLLLGVIIVIALYPSFPHQWVVHWNISGQADNWVNKTPAAAGFLLLIAGGLTCIFTTAAWLFAKAPRTRMPAEWADLIVQTNQNYLYLLATSLNLFLIYLACTLPYGPPNPILPIILVIIAITYPMYNAYQLASKMRTRGATPPGYQGLLYNNPNDPRIWVPKLIGYGWTLNFAHARARLIGILLVGIPILLVSCSPLILRLAMQR